MGCLIPGVPAKIVAMVKKTGLFWTFLDYIYLLLNEELCIKM